MMITFGFLRSNDGLTQSVVCNTGAFTRLSHSHEIRVGVDNGVKRVGMSGFL